MKKLAGSVLGFGVVCLMMPSFVHAGMCENPRTGVLYMVGGDRARQECKKGHVVVPADEVLPDIGAIVEDYIALHPEIIPPAHVPSIVRRIQICTFRTVANVTMTTTCACDLGEVWEVAGLYGDTAGSSPAVHVDVAPAKVANGPFTNPVLSNQHHIAHIRLRTDYRSEEVIIYVRCARME